MTQSDFIMATAVNEVNNLPLFRHQRYVYLTPNMIVSPMFEMTMGNFESNVMEKYFDALQPYLQLIADLSVVYGGGIKSLYIVALDPLFSRTI